MLHVSDGLCDDLKNKQTNKQKMEEMLWKKQRGHFNSMKSYEKAQNR